MKEACVLCDAFRELCNCYVLFFFEVLIFFHAIGWPSDIIERAIQRENYFK